MANSALMRGDASIMHKSWYRLLRQEFLRRKKSRRKQQQRESNEEDDSGLILPMELMEKILARVPFPDVFKGRVLSRSWRRKFFHVSQRSRPSCPLLKELSFAAVRWPTFCPVYMTSRGDLMGYNHTSHNWEKVVMSAYIPVNSTHSNLVVGRKIEFGGPLMCIYDTQVPFHSMGLSMFELFVANIQTGSWKTIVCPKDLEISHRPHVMLIHEPGLDDYKILVYDLKRPHAIDILADIHFEIHIFDSASRTWTSRESHYGGRLLSPYCTGSNQVHADGNLYFIGPGVGEDPEDHYLRHFVDIVKYNMADNIWSKSTTSIQWKLTKVHDVGGVFRCSSKLLLVIVDQDRDMDEYSIRPFEREFIEDVRKDGTRSRLHGACVYDVCPKTLEIESDSTSPVGMFRGICRSMMSDENNIYFLCSNCPGKTKAIIVRFNVSEWSWDRLPTPPTDICRNTVWSRSAYVPGQNPFATA